MNSSDIGLQLTLFTRQGLSQLTTCIVGKVNYSWYEAMNPRSPSDDA